MIWNDLKIHVWAASGGVTPFDESCVNPASLDLRLGNTFVDLETMKPFSAETIDLLPGMAILATTIEVVNIPVETAATIYLKSSMARQGLDHALAGWIDPGFCDAQITLELHAHRPVILHAGQRVVQMVLMQMIAPPLKPYQGRYQGQRGPTVAREKR